MTQVLRQSTQVVVRIGPFVDVGDGFTPETGVTLSGADEAEALKAAGAGTASIASNTWAAITGADGWYDLTLSTTDTNTIGTLDIVVQDDSVCLPVFARFQVIEESTYDFLYVSGADPDGDVAAILADTNELQSDDYPTSLAAIETDTQDIQSRLPAALVNSRMDSTVDGTGMEAAAAAVIVDAWETQSQADPTGFQVNVKEVNGTAQTANDNGADINNILTDTADMQPKLGTITDLGAGATIGDNLADMAGATFATSTDSLEAIRNRGDAAWTTGAGGSNPWAIASGTIGATGNDSTHLHLDGLGYADDDLNGYLIVVTDDSASLVYSTWITDFANTGDLATVETLPFTPEASTDTYVVVAINRETLDDSADIAAILADTNELQGDWTNDGRLDLIIDAILADTNELQTDDIPTSIAALPTAAENRAEMDSNSTQLAAIVADTNELQSDDYPTSLAAIETDTQDIQSRIPAALTAGGNIKADVLAISGDTTAADRLEALMDGILIGQVNDASATVSAFAADGFTEATDDHFVGRLITFVTGNLAFQQTDITSYDASGGTQGEQEFTVTALTEAPANDDFFVVH